MWWIVSLIANWLAWQLEEVSRTILGHEIEKSLIYGPVKVFLFRLARLLCRRSKVYIISRFYGNLVRITIIIEIARHSLINQINNIGMGIVNQL